MKESQEEQKPQAADYADQNRQLRELFEARMRQKQQQQQQSEQPPQMQQALMSKQIKQNLADPDPENKEKKETPLAIPFFQNTVFFDTRQPKPSFFIKIFSLFNDDPLKPSCAVSKNVESIFISTFGFQLETFDKILNESPAKLCILNDTEMSETKIIPNYQGAKNLTVILKAKKKGATQYGVFHTKLWLIKFKQFLRVVVCTSNQHVMDWAVWLNSYWYQDFPLKREGDEQNDENYEGPFNFNKDFKQTLSYVLAEMMPTPTYLQQIGIRLTNYVFKDIKVVLIPSVAGRHQSQEMQRQGIVKLRSVMRIFNKMEKPKITYNSTSLGMVDYDTLKFIHDGFCPNSKYFEPQRFSLIYPTARYIHEETGGQAQVLFLKSQNYNKSKEFAKQVLHRFNTNPHNPILGCIPHLKVAFIEEQGNSKGIVYMGSHNMTKAAWGRLQKKDTQIYISNSELGLLMFDVPVQDFKKWTPFQYPAQKYKPDDEPYLR